MRLGFWNLKKNFRKSKANSLLQVEEIVKSSTPSGLNQCIITGTENGDVLVPIYDWLKYFKSKNWKSVEKITKYSHFYFSAERKGVVETKTSINGTTIKNRITFNIEKMNLSDFPPKIDPLGLTYKRKQYLYEKIRQYCEDPFKDLLCPHPGIEPENVTAETEDNVLNIEPKIMKMTRHHKKNQKDQERNKKSNVKEKNH